MRKYETVFIADPDLSEQAREDLFERVRNIIDKENGIFLTCDTWGLKKLSYEIKKKLRGYYVCFTYGGTGALVTELERNLRLSDLIMKFMTVLVTEHVSEESLRQEVEQAKQAAEQQAQAAVEQEAAKEEVKEEVKEEATQTDAKEQDDKAEEKEDKTDDQEDAQQTESEQTSEAAEESKE